MNKLDKNKELLEGSQQLEVWEGYRAEMYLCPSNIETIGIGRNLEVYPLDPEELEEDGTYSHVNATAWAYDLLASLRKDLIIRLPWLTEQPPEVRILVTDMAYNMGVQGLLGFKNMLACLKAEAYSQAAMELQDSRYFGQTGQRSLAHYRTLVALSVA